MKQLAFITRVDDRERNEYIQRRLTMQLTDDQYERLNSLMAEIWDNRCERNGKENVRNFPHPEWFGAEGSVTFTDRELEGDGWEEPKEDEPVCRNKVSLMDYLLDWKGKKHDRFNIANGFTVIDEDGNEVETFRGFFNF